MIKAYHKSHILKVMVICTIGYAFLDNVENEGTAVKLNFNRCESFKVSGQLQRELRRVEDGKLVYNDKVLRKKGDIYKVDCNVTRLLFGTADNPKFALLEYFQELVFQGGEGFGEGWWDIQRIYTHIPG